MKLSFLGIWRAPLRLSRADPHCIAGSPPHCGGPAGRQCGSHRVRARSLRMRMTPQNMVVRGQHRVRIPHHRYAPIVHPCTVIFIVIPAAPTEGEGGHGALPSIKKVRFLRAFFFSRLPADGRGIISTRLRRRKPFRKHDLHGYRRGGTFESPKVPKSDLG